MLLVSFSKQLLLCNNHHAKQNVASTHVRDLKRRPVMLLRQWAAAPRYHALEIFYFYASKGIAIPWTPPQDPVSPQIMDACQQHPQ